MFRPHATARRNRSTRRRPPRGRLGRSLAAIGCLILLTAAGGCGDDGPGTTNTTDCSAIGEVGSDASCEKLCPIANQAFCAADATTLVCSELAPVAKVEMCGVGLPKPPADTVLERSPDVDEFGGSGPPQLDCFEPTGYPDAPGTSEMVTLQGVAKIFSHGCESRDLQIEVFTVKRGGADDGLPDQLVGSAVTTAADCMIAGIAEENDDCGTRYECRYEYPNVPSETELMVVTDGALWAPIYEYNLYIRNDEVVGGAYQKDVRALAQDDYGVIAQVALGSNITPGNGAIAGEVHDCGDVRLVNAVVDVDTPRLVATYFTDNEENPLPDLDADATSILGLYAAMDISPGPVTVAAAGIHNGRLVGTGYLRVRVFADAITSVTFRGMQPFQLP